MLYHSVLLVAPFTLPIFQSKRQMHNSGDLHPRPIWLVQLGALPDAWIFALSNLMEKGLSPRSMQICMGIVSVVKFPGAIFLQ